MVDQLERICGNCNHFFPDTSEPTENGICLADEKCSAEERHMAADFEYHAASADHLFQDAIGQPEQPSAIPGEVLALAIDPTYAPAILTVGTHEYILGRTKEAKRLLLDLVNLPEDTEDLPVIIDKAARFLIERHDIGMAAKLYSAACEKFPDEHTFDDGIAYWTP